MFAKIKLIVFAFLAAFCGFFYFQSAYRGAKIDRLQAEKNSINEQLTRCKNEMESYIKADERADKTICEIRTVVKTVKSPCDCYNSSVDPAIIDRVRGK